LCRCDKISSLSSSATNWYSISVGMGRSKNTYSILYEHKKDIELRYYVTIVPSQDVGFNVKGRLIEGANMAPVLVRYSSPSLLLQLIWRQCHRYIISVQTEPVACPCVSPWPGRLSQRTSPLFLDGFRWLRRWSCQQLAPAFHSSPADRCGSLHRCSLSGQTGAAACTGVPW
jgi:hypothetical protein